MTDRVLSCSQLPAADQDGIAACAEYVHKLGQSTERTAHVHLANLYRIQLSLTHPVASLQAAYLHYSFTALQCELSELPGGEIAERTELTL